MLELVDLSKKYKQVYAVNHLNMVINKGEIVGLLGPNGAGKSTAISMMSSLSRVSRGSTLAGTTTIERVWPATARRQRSSALGPKA